MIEYEFHQQKHGYRNGHQLLEGNIRLERSDQDAVDRLSDLSGQIRPGEVIPSYLTIYPLPSGTHTVVARTWPDLGAPRAGCVLTRSVFVPRSYWESAPDIGEVIALAGTSPDQGVVSGHLDLAGVPSIPIASEPRTAELIEALFFEQRKPIVVFEADAAELLARRLITAFWPAFRSSFAMCTYALGPRKIGGRDFDLVFAPKSVRSRFASWQGRKIDAGPPKAVRHRWAQAIADAVFRASAPSLAAPDNLGLLNSERADESAFRKTLLWRELAEKASTTPSAILGLLDIVNSQPGLAHDAMRSSLPLIVGAIETAVSNSPAQESWRFLETLYGKVEGREGLERVGLEITEDAKELAALDTDAAMAFSQKFADDSETIPVGLLLGVGEGLAKAKSSGGLSGLPARIGSFLLANSDEFSGEVAQRIRDGRVSADTVMSFLQAGEGLWREKAVHKLTHQANALPFAALLPALLRRKSSDEAGAAAIDVIRQSRLAFPEFDDAIISAIRNEESMRQTRNVVVAEIDPERADRFLLKTLTLSFSDVEWLVQGDLRGPRSSRLLANVLDGQNDRSIVEAQRNPIIRRQMLDILAAHPSGAEHAIAKLMVLGAPTVDELLEFGSIAINGLELGQLRTDLVNTVLERALVEAKPTDKRVERLVQTHMREVGARTLIWWSTNGSVANDRLSANLAILQNLKLDDRLSLYAVVDDLCDRLARRTGAAIDEEICSAWASLLWDARTSAPGAHLRAASLTLSALIDRTRQPVGEVLPAAFPAVYQELVSRNDDEHDGILALVMSLPRMFVNDWDQAKPARHGLVDAFMSSSWPPSYLLLAASRAGIIDRICLRVLRQKGGKKFLDRAIGDLARLDATEVASIRQALSELDGDALQNEWD